MKKKFAAIAAALMLTCSAPAVLAADYGTITVDGYAQETYMARQAVVMVTAQTEKDTLAEAKAENDRVSRTFRNSLTTLQIPDNDIVTKDFHINERNVRIGDTDQYRKTYVVSNTLQVTVNDRTKTSKVIDQAAAAGIDTVRLAKLDYNDKDKETQRQNLLIEAAKNARQKADALAAALGTRVLGVDSLNTDYPRYPMRLMTAKVDTALGASQSSVEYGDQTEEMHITVVFKVK
ncbi:SIMPL domain-containing protein [Megasphaera vaginalis (ex Bordigoni et al. 2020)]|uniref:SIMPL domain-containing protein n=1 Tax=Megasphaera vaginalis (ex Bordigoni et al. 2020) TaxID=2045301 RepID=UPI000C7B6CE3|nr:SIMPL domain-containing protein [Megasphaera vaginalis (ex Bordigoni et al. 2020)]